MQAFLAVLSAKEMFLLLRLNASARQNTQAFDRIQYYSFCQAGTPQERKILSAAISHVQKTQALLLQMDCTETHLLLKDRKLKKHLIMQKL